MIIQCEKCKTRFRLDDSKISESGVRVRCSRCTHTFVVRREPAEPGDFDSILQGWGGHEGEERKSPVASGEAEASAVPSPSGEELTVRETEMKEPPVKWEEEPAETPEQSAAVPVADEESPVLSVMGAAPPELPASEETGTGFDECGDLPVETEDVAEEPSPAGETVVEEFRNDSGDKEESALPRTDRSALGVGEMTAGPELRWPVAEDIHAGATDDLPPLSISSRRKGPRILPYLLIVALLVVAGAGGYFMVKTGGGIDKLLPGKLRGLAGGLGKSGDQAAIRSLEGAFYSNREAGELFVVSGEVFNGTGKPLTSIRVTGTVYGKKGEVLARRTVYCGNLITREQAAFLPFSSIEKTMGRQFGETLANLDVAPGKSVPFTIVFRDMPKGAAEYGAKVAVPGE